MTRRFTQTEKWSDPWFRALPVEAKLLFHYICDVCDIAGFWEIDLDAAATATGLPADERLTARNILPVGEAFALLSRAYLRGGDENRFIWLRRFLHHQGNWPLKPDCQAHKGVLKRLIVHNSMADMVLANLYEQESPPPSELLTSLVQDLDKSLGNGRGNGKGKGKSKKSKKSTKRKTTEQDIRDSIDAQMADLRARGEIK